MTGDQSVTDEHPVTEGDARARGGPQHIPRPSLVLPGDPPPWHELSPGERTFDLDTLVRRFEDLGPAVRSPRAGQAEGAAAVLAGLYEHEGELWVVLTRRSRHLRVHRGEVSFPGGRQDPGEDLFTTALREAEEEVALDRGLVQPIGELDHLTTMVSSSFIVPYVVALSRRPDLRASPDEVEAVLHVPVSELLAHEREERWWLYGGYRPIVFFDLVGDTVWGATGAMLRQLLGIGTGTLGRGDLGHD